MKAIVTDGNIQRRWFIYPLIAGETQIFVPGWRSPRLLKAW